MVAGAIIPSNYRLERAGATPVAQPERYLDSTALAAGVVVVY